MVEGCFPHKPWQSSQGLCFPHRPSQESQVSLLVKPKMLESTKHLLQLIEIPEPIEGLWDLSTDLRSHGNEGGEVAAEAVIIDYHWMEYH